MKPIKLAADPIDKVYAGLVAEEIAKVKSYQRPPRRFRASEMSQCRRRIWYRLSGYVPTPDQPWLRLVAEAGGMYHDYVRYIMNAFGVGLTGFKDVGGKMVEDKYLIRECEHDGRKFSLVAQADAGVEVEVDGVPVTASVEIKSMSFFKHDKLQRTFRSGNYSAVFDILKAEHPNYLWQANTTALVKGVRHVLLVLVGRSGNDLGLSGNAVANPDGWPATIAERTSGAFWEVEESDTLNILQKAADIERALDAGDPPNPDYTDGSQECRQCPFWTYCHGANKRAVYPIPGVVS